MKTVTITAREMLWAIKQSGWDKEVGMTIKSIKPQYDGLLNSPITISLPETVEEFDEMAAKGFTK